MPVCTEHWPLIPVINDWYERFMFDAICISLMDKIPHPANIVVFCGVCCHKFV